MPEWVLFIFHVPCIRTRYLIFQGTLKSTPLENEFSKLAPIHDTIKSNLLIFVP